MLADEQVDENGCSWRSGAKVERKLLRQWFVRTTKFAKQLLAGLDDAILHDWRDVIKVQRHWIGECDGVSFDFNVIISRNGGDGGCQNEKMDFVTLWTSTPEHVKHCKFVAVTNNHILAKSSEIGSGSNGTRKLTSIQLTNPFNGEIIPVYVTNEIEFLQFTDSFMGLYSK